ncbi:MAG: LacI family DNA-binding transcriptional regulator [Anaerolineales bacterium]
MTNKVTLSQLAAACGVSAATVSLALNGRPGVSEGTRQQILETARRLGYNAPPRPVSARRKIATIGMLVKTEPGLPPSSNPFYSQVIAGVDDACRDMGINLLFATLPVNESNHPTSVPPFIETTPLDGLLMIGAFLDQTIQSLLGARTPPIVLVDGYSDTERYDMVVSDNFRAAYQAVEHLIRLGHRHIGLVGGYPDCYPSLCERRNGYARALKENGLSQVYAANFNVSRETGEAEIEDLLTRHPNITAVFCVNDAVAVNTLRVAHRLGRRVPQDLSIIGYDDIALAAQVTPALTTMRVDTLAMGRAAVHLLALRIEKPDAARLTFIIHPTLIERETTAPLA